MMDGVMSLVSLKTDSGPMAQALLIQSYKQITYSREELHFVNKTFYLLVKMETAHTHIEMIIVRYKSIL